MEDMSSWIQLWYFFGLVGHVNCRLAPAYPNGQEKAEVIIYNV